MKFTLTIEVEVSRISGKFATRDEIQDFLIAEIEGSNPGTVDGVGADGETEYEIDNWEVSA